MLPGAMPFSHRWLGNPRFSWLTRRMSGASIHDVYCGMRGFTKDLFARLDERCTGMEFATEMIIKASLQGKKIGEVAITLTRTDANPMLRIFGLFAMVGVRCAFF